MERKEVQVDEGISLIEIFKLLLSRITLLVLVVFIAGLLGGTVAFFRSVNVDYYGTKAEYYINPTREDVVTDTTAGVYGTYSASVMDGIVRLLNSESFTEQLLLNGKSLPVKNKYGKDADEKAALNGLIDGAQGFVDVFNVAKSKYDKAVTERTEASTALTESTKELNVEWTKWKTKEADKFTTTAYNEGVYGALDLTDSKYQSLHEKKEAYDDANEAYDNAETAVEAAKTALSKATENMNEVVDVVMEKWSQTPQYKAELSQYVGAVSFSYLAETTSVNEATSSARCFLYVHISVLNDKKFAESLFERIKDVLPTYVENNMPLVTGYTGTNCRRITRNDDISITNPMYTTKQVIKFALIAGAGALVIACIVLVLLDKSDKRLRDTEVITKKFNLPILGLIPDVDTDADKSSTKKTAEVK